jgi:phage shock protein PspC (stress-responsive transcriptional regulator)
MLGGVASGLAAYFHVPVRNVRLIFAAPILINMLLSLLELFNDSFYVSIGFGSLTGTFVLAYIIIWIILPEALTPYQKMEMRGEKVDLDRIRQTVKDGLGNVEERMKAWGAEVKETAEQWSARMKEQNRAMAERHTTSRTVLHGIGSIVRFGIYLFLGAIAFALLVSGAAILFAGVVTLPAQDLFWTSPAQQWGFWLTILLFFIVPVLFLLIALIRRMFRVRRRSKMLRWSFLSLWALGWIFLFWTASSLARDFEYKRHTSTAIALSDSLREVMVFDQSAPPYEYSGSFKWIKADDAGFDITRDTFKVPAVGIQLELSSDSAYHARLLRYSFGRDEEQAMSRIKNIDYPVIVRDSVIDLAPGFAVTRDEKYRGQHVVLVLSVPKGKSVRFTESFLENHERMGINHTSKSRGDGDVHVGWSSNGEWGITQKRLNRYKPGVDYIMEEDGYLSPKN